MASSSEVDLHNMLTVVQSMEGVVAKYYGPSCYQTLLTSSTGKAVVTADGYTILQALHFSHPVAFLVKNAIEKCHSQTHDGCKTFLIYLSSILRSVDSHLAKFHTNGTSNGNGNLIERQALITVSVVLNKLIGELTLMYQQLVEHSLKLYKLLNANNNCLEILKSVSVTTLLPQFSPRLSNFISCVLIQLIMGEDEPEIVATLRFMIDNFDIIAIKAANQPYHNCRKAVPYLICRDFSLKCDNINGPLNALFICCPIDVSRSDSESLESFSVKSSAQLSDSLHHRNKLVDTFARMCTEDGVNLVLSTEMVPGYALDVFKKYDISVVSCVLTEDIQIIEYLTCKTSVNDIFSKIEETNIIPVNHCAGVIIGTQKYIQMKFDSRVKFNHLIVCAPTFGLCDQLRWLTQKALKAMLNCFNSSIIENAKSATCESLSDRHDHNFNRHLVVSSDRGNHIGTEERNNLNLIGSSCKHDKETLGQKPPFTSVADPGEITVLLIETGGCFEILLSKYIENFAKICKETNTSTLCHILIEALMTVPHTLYMNTAENTPRSRQYLKVKQKLMEKVQQGSVCGIDMHGDPRDMTGTGCVEPLLAKIHTLDCVLRLVVQLLRIDEVLSGKINLKERILHE